MNPSHLLPDILDHLLAQAQRDYDPATATLGGGVARLLTAVDRAQLQATLTEITCEPGQIICHEGAPGDALFVIRAGLVAVLKGDLAAPTVLGYRGPGEIIGEMALLEDQPRSASTVALNTVRLLRISRDQFRQLLHDNREMNVSIMAALSARLRSADTERIRDDQEGRQLARTVRELRDENEQLLELERVRQETTDLIVHDLRNPLGVLGGVLHVLELILPPDTYAENHDLIATGLAAYDRMLRLVDSLLDVSKLETGEFQVSLARANIRPALQDVLRRQQFTADLHQIELVLSAPETLPTVLVDLNMLDRVLTNLIDNAIKYTPAGGTITTRCEVTADALVLRVIDSGPGIPAAERERIFERFAQIAGDSPRQRGFGLGLTFCKLAVEAHGGAIWVESGPDDTGACFAFTLPLPAPA